MSRFITMSVAFKIREKYNDKIAMSVLPPCLALLSITINKLFFKGAILDSMLHLCKDIIIIFFAFHFLFVLLTNINLAYIVYLFGKSTV